MKFFIIFRYNESAVYFAQTQNSFEEICLKYLELGDMTALRKFLTCKLNNLDSEKVTYSNSEGSSKTNVKVSSLSFFLRKIIIFMKILFWNRKGFIKIQFEFFQMVRFAFGIFYNCVYNFFLTKLKFKK